MIRAHDTEHEKLLEQLTCGDLEREDPKLVAVLEECAECRDRVSGLESVSDLLELAALEQRETLADPNTDADLPGRDLVGPFIRARLAERRRSRWLHYAAAAAVIASAGGGWWAMNRLGPVSPQSPQSGGSDGPVLLGSKAFRFEGLQEGGALELGPIQWEFGLPPGGSYELELLNAQGAPLTPGERLQQSEWIPSPEEVERLPDEFRLRLTAYDAFDQDIASVIVPVARSR
jgi:hypothetical protein